VRGELMRAVVSSVLELAGLTLVAVAGFLLAPWVGAFLAGVGLVVVGLALDPPARGDR